MNGGRTFRVSDESVWKNGRHKGSHVHMHSLLDADFSGMPPSNGNGLFWFSDSLHWAILKPDVEPSR